MVRQNFFLLLILFFNLPFCFSCNNTLSSSFYEPLEANVKIAQAFAIKDSACGSSHRITSFILGRAKITNVDACVKAIELLSCVQWNVNDPTPDRCKSINFKL